MLKSHVEGYAEVVEASAFIGARIRQLREQAGLQAQELARELDLDPSAISNIERGRRGVKTDELVLIASVLGVSTLAILDEHSLLGRLPVAPRISATEIDHTQVRTRLTAIAELHVVLSNGGFPAQPKLDGAPEVNPGDWLRSAVNLAHWVRKVLEATWTSSGDERFDSLVQAIETTLGIDVLVEPWVADVFGASVTDPEFPFIFVNSDQSVPRALFTLAHELGHVFSHGGEPLRLDVGLTSSSDEERFANAFAANLLMPEEKVRQYVSKENVVARNIAAALDQFGVSYQSFVYRLHNLGVINATARDALLAHGFRGLLSQLEGEEPLASRLVTRSGNRPAVHRPALMTERALTGYLRGVIGVRPVANLLGMDPDELALMMATDAADSLSSAFNESAQDENDDEVGYGGNPV